MRTLSVHSIHQTKPRHFHYNHLCLFSTTVSSRYEYLEHEYSAQSMSINHLHVTLCSTEVAQQPSVRLGHVTVSYKTWPLDVVRRLTISSMVVLLLLLLLLLLL